MVDQQPIKLKFMTFSRFFPGLTTNFTFLSIDSLLWKPTFLQRDDLAFSTPHSSPKLIADPSVLRQVTEHEKKCIRLWTSDYLGVKVHGLKWLIRR